MKKIIVLLAFVAGIATSGYSQFIKRGTILGGGSFEFRSHKDDADNKQSNFGLAPWAGYVVVDNVVVGALLSVSTGKNEGVSFTNTSTDIMFGPVARYYMDNGLFAHGQFAVGSGKVKTEFTGSPSSETKFGTSEFRLGAGYAVRITDTVLFEPIVGFLSQSRKNKSSNVKNTENGFFFMGGFTIFLHSTN